MLEGTWYLEKHTEDLLFLHKIKRHIYHGKTAYQKVDIVEVEVFGKALFLDGKIQSAQIDEAIYHEALVHPAMLTHPDPKKVIILGGGEGATLREALRHPIERATMVDIDEQLVKLCEAYLPEWHAGAFYDERSKLIFADARSFLENSDETYDVVISDLTEPLEGGPSVMLFTKEFYTTVYKRLSEDGVLVVQSASADPYYNQFVRDVYVTLKEIFPVVRVYHAPIFSFQMDWAFTLASKGRDPKHIPLQEIERRISDFASSLFFYTPQLHGALFELPKFLQDALSSGRVITDENPPIWTA
ncbi:MAG: polyamine aminopropyltransferase [Thermotogae bacterium]|nr:polyamine aminopropyltransferase [Thermotogota bacterium]